ncbi:RlpA-like double-psi beta-barrel domain-containing protein [Kitasatospora sp. NBC_01560]|uniref:RlpA-like double-psi beta-barrel domain-containing protein n=1 Tax=Kitasatospora sp. NBC_01560 TaxID=2975965 RepID=UPI00387008A5
MLLATGVFVMVAAAPSSAADFKGRASYYSPGLGACGWVSNPNQDVVSLNSAMFGAGFPGPNCGRKIKVTYGKKSVTVTVVDEAPGEPMYGISLTEGAFRKLASLDAGVIQVKWHWVDSKPDPQTTTPKWKPKPDPGPSTPVQPDPGPSTPVRPGPRAQLAAAQPAPQPQPDTARTSPHPR